MPLKLNNLEQTYAKGTPFEHTAIKNITVTFGDGEFIGLIGHTGSGKSTLIQHLNALLEPTNGTIILDDEDIFKDKKSKIWVRQQVGLVFQYPEHQLFEETIEKDVAFGPTNLGLAPEEILKRVKQSLDMVGLDYEIYKSKSPFELSGGQMRRVAIAGVLAMEPRILVLDEPTAGLDPRGRDDILAQIKSLHEKTGNTTILVSHNMEDIGRLVDKVLVMHKGEMMYYAPPREVFSHVEELESMGLAVPEVTYLMHKLKAHFPTIRQDILTVEEAKEEILKHMEGNADV